ncbi:hypothetical protein [Actinomadura sp. BRA 177]|nr:hypothetical protein [Actinomadura sp. BRA 177]
MGWTNIAPPTTTTGFTPTTHFNYSIALPENAFALPCGLAGAW